MDAESVTSNCHRGAAGTLGFSFSPTEPLWSLISFVKFYLIGSISFSDSGRLDDPPSKPSMFFILR